MREIGFEPGRGRRLRIDGEPARSLAAWRARAVLVFLPDELRAVKGPPAARRRALDRVLEAASPAFADDLSGLQGALAQRNALLRRIRAGAASEATLPAWEAPIARLGARVGAARRAGAAALAGPFAAWLEALGGGPGGLLRLEPSPADAGRGARGGPGGGAGVGDARAPAARDPGRPDAVGAAPRRPLDRRRRGDLRREGSQGEQRTAALAMLLAARDHLRAHAARPILLLDDVLSELDPDRRRLLLEAVRDGGQTIVTSADPASATLTGRPPDGLLHVEDGRILGRAPRSAPPAPARAPDGRGGGRALPAPGERRRPGRRDRRRRGAWADVVGPPPPPTASPCGAPAPACSRSPAPAPPGPRS